MATASRVRSVHVSTTAAAATAAGAGAGATLFRCLPVCLSGSLAVCLSDIKDQETIGSPLATPGGEQRTRRDETHETPPSFGGRLRADTSSYIEPSRRVIGLSKYYCCAGTQHARGLAE
ncbi:hypothetical protein BZA05DRAFT_414707 [Tricharina praecox]|uniref:uncharacterized protein n=1 Tax=Tricharina praecox TaxID=43433 RepID=UPI00221EFE80|nr:uncharacterized protein BZA05DRAFT_414707 [Tricharina praecox]KAI5858955.1 hypothetical protein BZA05DRAFT_414707 [Tricharina praecox]